MDDATNFRVNDDGSVTIAKPSNNHETIILDILRLEKAKGGIFVCCRMRTRALNYAKSANIPNLDIIVEKLMFDNYPNDFTNLAKTRELIIWMVITAVFFIGIICFALISSDYISMSIICLCISGLGIWQCKRISSKIREQFSK